MNLDPAIIQGAIFTIVVLAGALLWVKLRPTPPKTKEVEVLEQILELLKSIDNDLNLSSLGEMRDDLHAVNSWLERIYEEK